MEGATRPKVRIEVYSDLICPWCYVGKKHLSMAIEMRPQYDIQYDTMPYILTNPQAQNTEVAYYQTIFGGDKTAVMDQVKAQQDTGALVGLKLKVQTIPFGVDSFLGHRLIHYAKGFGKDSLVEDILFRNILEENKDIGDGEVLLAAGAEAGLPNVREFLESDEGSEEVWLQDFTAKHNNHILGAPFYVFNGSFGVSGMQTMSQILTVLDQVAAAAPEEAPAPAESAAAPATIGVASAPSTPAQSGAGLSLKQSLGGNIPTTLLEHTAGMGGELGAGGVPQPAPPAPAPMGGMLQSMGMDSMGEMDSMGGMNSMGMDPNDFLNGFEFPNVLQRVSHPDPQDLASHNPKFEDFDSIFQDMS